MPGSNCETWSQIYDNMGSSIHYSAGPVLTLNGRITASDYVDILGSLVHPVVHVLFPNNDAVFQDDNWPNLNIIELLWSVLESRVRSRFPPSSLKQPEEEWYTILLETVQNLRESISRRIQAVLQANGGPTPY